MYILYFKTTQEHIKFGEYLLSFSTTFFVSRLLIINIKIKIYGNVMLSLVLCDCTT